MNIKPVNTKMRSLPKKSVQEPFTLQIWAQNENFSA